MIPHAERRTLENTMAFTKSQIIEAVSEKTGVEKTAVEAILDCLAQLAYEHAKEEFVLPGIGKLVVVDKQARRGRNPRTGAEIQIPAKRALKFRIAKAAKEAILAAGTPPSASSTSTPSSAS
jgi:DNA-binding protein HU-beta